MTKKLVQRVKLECGHVITLPIANLLESYVEGNNPTMGLNKATCSVCGRESMVSKADIPYWDIPLEDFTPHKIARDNRQSDMFNKDNSAERPSGDPIVERWD